MYFVASLQEDGEGVVRHESFRKVLTDYKLGFSVEQMDELINILDNGKIANSNKNSHLFILLKFTGLYIGNTGLVYYHMFLQALGMSDKKWKHTVSDRDDDRGSISRAPIDFQIILTGVEFRALLGRFVCMLNI